MTSVTGPAAAIVLAGGRGHRLGDVDKPELADRHGRTLLDSALAAVSGALVIAVGPPRSLAPGIICVREDPPGGGPAAAVAAGCRALSGSPATPTGTIPPDALVAVLAADLPYVTAATVGRLSAAVRDDPESGGAVLLDASGRRQYLLGVWRFGALLAAVHRRESWHGAALRDLLAPIPVVESPALGRETIDIDTPDDLRQWRRL